MFNYETFAALLQRLNIIYPAITVGSTSTDNAININTALATAEGLWDDTNKRTYGGKSVILPSGDIYIKTPIVITRKSGLIGQPGTRIIASTDFVGDRMIELKQYPSNIKSNIADQFILKGFILNGNKSGMSVSVTTFTDTSGNLQIDRIAHGLRDGDVIMFPFVDGSILPSTLSNYKTYYVKSSTANNFQVSLTAGGTSILFGAGSGVEYFKKFLNGLNLDVTTYDSTVPITSFTDTTGLVINKVGHGLSAGDIVQFPYVSGAVLPRGLTPSTNYYVISSGLTADAFKVSTTSGGTAVAYSSDSSGTSVYFKKTTTKYDHVVDNLGLITDIKIEHCSNNGLYEPFVGPSIFRFINLDLNWNGGDGFYNCGTDNYMHGINMNGNYRGMYLNSANNMVSNCKAYYSEVADLYIDEGGTGNKINNFECQEGLSTALYMRRCKNVQITNFVGESCGHDGKGTTAPGSSLYNGIGIVMEDTKSCIVRGVISNRPNLAGDIQYAVKWIDTDSGSYACRDNIVDIRIADTSGIRPIEYWTDVTPPITNQFIVNNIPHHLPNIFEKIQRVMADTNSDGLCDGFTLTKSGGMTATASYDTTHKCQKLNITDNNGTGNTAKFYIDVPVTAGDTISLAMRGKCDYGVKFSCSLAYYSDAPSILSTSTGSVTNSNTINPTSAIDDNMFLLTYKSKQTIPATTTFVRISFVIQTNSVVSGVSLNAYLNEIFVTLESVKNPPQSLKWTNSPITHYFVPNFVGQLFIDTTNAKTYIGTGGTRTDWQALN